MHLEAMSLCQALDDWPSCKALFYEGLDHGVTGKSLALWIDEILELGDLEWARDVIGDPRERLHEIQQLYEVVRMVSPRNLATSDLSDEMCSRQTVQLIRAVARIHGLEMAQMIRADALALREDPKVRAALSTP